MKAAHKIGEWNFLSFSNITRRESCKSLKPNADDEFKERNIKNKNHRNKEIKIISTGFLLHQMVPYRYKQVSYLNNFNGEELKNI